MKRTPLRRTTPLNRGGPLRRRTRLRPISDRRRERDADYDQTWHLVGDRAGWKCEARTPACTGGYEQRHHLAGRLGDDPHNPSKLLACCRPCHEHIHRFPQESYEHGWMVRRVPRKGETP